MRLTTRELQAILSALNMMLAGVFDDDDDVEAMESARDKILTRLNR